jgi:hypothetical protein
MNVVESGSLEQQQKLISQIDDTHWNHMKTQTRVALVWFI